jgi:hypothetical protein
VPGIIPKPVAIHEELEQAMPLDHALLCVVSRDAVLLGNPGEAEHDSAMKLNSIPS